MRLDEPGAGGRMVRWGGKEGREGEVNRNTIKLNARGALAQELKKECESIFLNLLNSCRISVGWGVGVGGWNHRVGVGAKVLLLQPPKKNSKVFILHQSFK